VTTIKLLGENIRPAPAAASTSSSSSSSSLSYIYIFSFIDIYLKQSTNFLYHRTQKEDFSRQSGRQVEHEFYSFGPIQIIYKDIAGSHSNASILLVLG